MKEFAIETRIKRAGILVFAGLAVQAATLLRVHPLSFVIFLSVGCPLIFGGIVLYLFSLVSVERAPAESEIAAVQTAGADQKARAAEAGEDASNG
jgi:hypothetical protein